MEHSTAQWCYIGTCLGNLVVTVKAGVGDGTLRQISTSTGAFIGKPVNLEHNTRIHCLIPVFGELWTSSEVGKIVVVDMEVRSLGY